MANINSILKNNNVVRRTAAEYETQMIHYSKLTINKKQFYTMEGLPVEVLADSIAIANGIQEPLIVRQSDADKYEILAGHKRWAATKMLVEERGLDKFKFVPCHICEADDWMAEFILITTNDYPSKSEYEKLCEVVRLTEILPHLKENEDIRVRTLRRKIAEITGLCETRVGNYTNIYNHLSSKAMTAFKNKQFGINAAIKIASLPHSVQDALVAQGQVKITDVERVIEEREAAKNRNHAEEAATPIKEDVREDAPVHRPLGETLDETDGVLPEKMPKSEDRDRDVREDHGDVIRQEIAGTANVSGPRRDVMLAKEMMNEFEESAKNPSLTETDQRKMRILADALMGWIRNTEKLF